ncbi:type II toxin-antitoxin system RelE/ParE family toxin [Chryseobacterium foetidum]|uniref:type II toxin-antitoxin system RelE/ParE family toxin n=1 Tax=Chryseobacterium foetidum TaxID=2951057 RepID=UPI0021C8F957|nr:type II toxin-antitoxin system RelE/ParE family toxin [Chryseobacterium foetidum]
MAKYNLTNEAVDDLTDIWNYTYEKWSEKQADLYYKMLLESFQQIADHPEIGRNYSEIRNDLYGLKTMRHIIFYRKLNDNSIEITRILHEQMDLKNRLNK